MNLPQAPRVMAMHDLCGYGRSSLNVVAPLLAAVNCECCALPTALLSSHVGFKQPSVLDLSPQLELFLDQWQREKFTFDAFYSGYITSPWQVEIALKFIKTFNPAFIYIDPVLGDNGALYPGFNEFQVIAMRKLVAHAHVISPNITEAQALLAIPLNTPFKHNNAKDYLIQLATLGPKTVCITGVPNPDLQRITTYMYEKEKDLFTMVYAPLLKTPSAGLHGTGDSLAAVLVGLLLADIPIEKAMSLAMNFLNKAIEGAHKFNREICIEYALPELVSRCPNAFIEEF
jgi:pyridoxine kinase